MAEAAANTSTPIKASREGDILVLTMDNPPVNASYPDLSRALGDAVVGANDDASVKAIVIIGANDTFMAGADLKRIGGPGTLAVHERAQYRMDLATKPIVAAIDGFALGAGCEVALASHYRVATKKAKIGLPEILTGIIPGAGGTQRLPRLAGPSVALDAMLSGKHYPAPEALKLGFIDEIVPDGADLREFAVAYARKIAGQKVVRVRDRDDRLAEAKADPEFFAKRRKAIPAKGGNGRAMGRIVDAVEAAVTLPFEQGMEKEGEYFRELVNSEEAKALRYAFFAERESRKIPGLEKLKDLPKIKKLGIIGAGTMGGGIAMAAAAAGIEVKLLDVTQEAVDKGIGKIKANYATSVKRGSTPQAEADWRLSKIAPTTQYSDFADVDAVIEAVFEDADLKTKIFNTLAEVTRKDAILMSNTSGINIDIFSADNPRKKNIAGAHFFSPANVMKLLEVIKATNTAPETLASVFELGRRMGKVSVWAGNCTGFVANRSRGPFTAQINFMIEEGALPEQVDRVMVKFGYPVGPCATGDIAGLDIGFAGRKRAAAKDPNYRKLYILDGLCELGRFGQKTGAGWFRYEPGSRTPITDPIVTELIERLSKERGIVRRQLSDEEILHRPLFAGLNEACRILQEGMALRGSDIDTMWLNGFGFPRHRGGLMYWADTIGSKKILEQMTEWSKSISDRFAPCDLLRETGEKGGSFRELVGKVAA